MSESDRIKLTEELGGLIKTAEEKRSSGEVEVIFDASKLEGDWTMDPRRRLAETLDRAAREVLADELAANQTIKEVLEQGQEENRRKAQMLDARLAEVSTKAQEVEDLSSGLASREMAVTVMENTIRERETAVSERSATLDDRAARIDELTLEVTERERNISARETAVLDREKSIEEREKLHRAGPEAARLAAIVSARSGTPSTGPAPLSSSVTTLPEAGGRFGRRRRRARANADQAVRDAEANLNGD